MITQKLVHNITTGNMEYVDLTQAEIDALAADRQAAQQRAADRESQEQARLLDLAQITRENYQNALAAIDSDIAALADGTTNAEVVAIVGRLLQRQRAIVRVVSALVANERTA